ncbi:tetratricopeptide repeat-containing sensor histidine kinase [uncultured Aquimarina sp.]|uniref:tetratricopeptide repeat-containing sensor histidine kinase n=1 Tax=uncultured Aquimarina sp. TaxID=575652 RepID=UPI0026339379|nr:tetratricopeptide repeat-containing sensor histidine kinase [uncultured Aquimarina sp.]
MKKTTLIVGLLMLLCYSGFSQNKSLDSILPTIKTQKDSVVFDNAMKHFKKLWLTGKYEIALSYENKLLSISKKIQYNKGIGDVYTQIGNVYNYTQQHIKAFHNYDKAIIYYKIANYPRGLAIINNNKSTIEQGRGNSEQAIHYILEANLYFERIKDGLVLSSTYNNMANIYSDIDKLELAEKYYKKSIALKKQHNSKKLGASLNNLALVYIAQKRIDSAEILTKESLKISKQNNSTLSESLAYNRLASLALDKREYQKSKKYYDSSYYAALRAQNNKVAANTKQQLGLIAIRTEKYEEAERLLTEARKELIKLKTTPLLLTNYKYSATLDSARGDFTKAFAWQKKYQEIADQNSSDETTEKITQAEARFKSELEQLKLLEEQKKRELQTKEELYRYRIFTFISLGVSILIFIFLIFIIKTRKERKRYIKELNESNQVKNKLFSIISHDLKNEIHGLDGTLNLLKEDAISTEEFQEIIPLLANKTHQTSIMLNNLLNWSKSQMKELNAKPTEFNIKDVIHSKFTFFEPKAELKDIKLENQLDSTMVFADKDMFSIVSQNLIANAIKFCKPGDSITLHSEEKEKHYEICFQDTGVGIPQENLGRLFSEDTFTTEGTQQETGTGLGLKICKELIELNKGEIKVKSILGEGSTFCITLPKAS